ncbi:MAG TPA: response regulator transcription factor [Terriglobales bacterium]|nr:response regulator transcription factor [Terriglobales bacterium]
MSGIDARSTILKMSPDARIITITTFEGDGPVRQALQAGCKSYILKNMPPKDILRTIRKVHSGGKDVPQSVATKIAEHFGDEQLTHRELDVLQHTAGGNRNRDIASKLFIAEETVKAHMKQIMSKLGASDRTQAVTIGLRRGFIQF